MTLGFLELVLKGDGELPKVGIGPLQEQQALFITESSSLHPNSHSVALIFFPLSLL